MKLSVLKVLLLACIIMCAGSLIAKELTLDDCINLALKNRASIIASRNSEQLAKVTERAALGAFLPSASASYSYTKSKDRQRKVEYDSAGTTVNRDLKDSDNKNKNTDISADLSFVLPDTWFSFAASKIDHQSAKLDVIGSEQDLIYSVKQAYYLYLAAVQNITVEEEAVKRSDEQLKLIQSKFELGSAAKSDVLKQKVQNGNDLLSLLQARNSVTNSKATLAYTIGLDPLQEHEFSTDYTVRQYDGTLQDAIQFGMAHKPSLLSTEKDIKSANQRLMSAYSQYLPKLSPFVNYGYGKTTSAPPPTYTPYTQSQLSLSYGFRVTLNIFDGFSREQRVASAKISKNNLQAQLTDSRNLVSSRIKTAYLDIEQLKERQKVSRDNVEAATEDLKITQEKYNLGAATILDLLNAQVSLKQAQVSQISADFDLNVAIANLENAMGKM